jgi:ATP-dependent exoDNAse (exonuclease V) alpha subunit
MDWSPQQTEALEKVRRWLGPEKWTSDVPGNRQVFRLFGYAGTGKTTLAIEIANMAGGDVLFASFTGKAALVMRKKGCFGASTLHSLIYKPRRKHREEEEDERTDHDIPAWELNRDSALRYARLLIIDECSMVSEELGRDVLSFGTPVLVLGDPAQLPPVNGAGFFTESEPDVMLTEIHRQAADNPIVRIATAIRTGLPLELGSHKGPTEGTGVSVIRRDALKRATELGAGQILCGKNDTRVSINKRMRQYLREEGLLPAGDHLPVVGDRVICLKNKRDRGLLNGGMWEVSELLTKMPDKKRGRAGVSYLFIESKDEDNMNYVSVPHQFWYWNNKAADLNLPEGMSRSHYDEFDYSYAITCHKSQGSQWDKVLIFDEAAVFGRDDDGPEMMRRWRYTALTRAAEAAIFVV